VEIENLDPEAESRKKKDPDAEAETRREKQNGLSI
jgi:hypothetical protein